MEGHDKNECDSDAVSEVVENYKREESNMIDRINESKRWVFQCEEESFNRNLLFDVSSYESLSEDMPPNDAEIREDMEEIFDALK